MRVLRRVVRMRRLPPDRPQPRQKRKVPPGQHTPSVTRRESVLFWFDWVGCGEFASSTVAADASTWPLRWELARSWRLGLQGIRKEELVLRMPRIKTLHLALQQPAPT